MAPKWPSPVTLALPLFPYFCEFGSLLAPFGSLLLPFGSLLAPFGSLLAHFWLPLAHFWCPWAHFCSPWGSIFSLLGSPGIIFHFFEYFRWNLTQNLIIWKCSLKIRLYWSSTSHIPEECHTYLNRRQIIFCNPPFKGPERNICLWQLRSAPGPEAPRAC